MTSLGCFLTAVVGPGSFPSFPSPTTAKPGGLFAVVRCTTPAPGPHTASLPKMHSDLTTLSRQKGCSATGLQPLRRRLSVSCIYIPVAAAGKSASTEAHALHLYKVRKLKSANPGLNLSSYICARNIEQGVRRHCIRPLYTVLVPRSPAATRSLRRGHRRMKIVLLPHLRSPGTPLLLLLVLAWTSAVCASVQPFRPVETATPVAKRQACLANFFSCADQGAAFNGICCQNGQRCALDANNNPACCPNG